MEDPHTPRRAAVVYAVLSLLARLLASHTAVFGLWFGRRCYERSRGEMITMLYEKMLTRKVIGLQEKRPEADSELVEDNTSESTTGSNKEPEQAMQSASMGKVLNLMRCVAHGLSEVIWLTMLQR
jgi:hypothetical protein